MDLACKAGLWNRSEAGVEGYFISGNCEKSQPRDPLGDPTESGLFGFRNK
jgi:hypothetical protein